MMCSHPFKAVINGVVRELPCGQCMACRINYSQSWASRIMAEFKYHDSSIFLTLTYDDEHLPENNSLCVRDVQLFLKRLRKFLAPRKIRYFLSGEYGDTFGRPHYHLILFNVSPNDICFDVYSVKGGLRGFCKCWDKGQVFIGTVTEDSSQYVAKYSLKKQKGKHAKEYYESLGIIPEFSLMSRNPGIGYQFCVDYADELKHHGTMVVKGLEKPLPRYYKEKLNYKSDYDSFAAFREFRKSVPKGFTPDEWREEVGCQQEKNIRRRNGEN